MTATLTAPRTTADLLAAAAERHPASDPNHAWHRSQFVKAIVAAAEREAYDTEDRRTIAVRFVKAVMARYADDDAAMLDTLVRYSDANTEASTTGGLIAPAHLMAVVPDQYGRRSPFAVWVRYERGEVATRNLSLDHALTMARVAIAAGHHATVGFDTCG